MKPGEVARGALASRAVSPPSRVYLVDGPNQGTVCAHELARGPYLRRRTLCGLEFRETLYRLFSRPTTEARGAVDFFAAQWCSACDIFRDRCRHAIPPASSRWVRFGPRFDQTKLEVGAPGTRESKWHELLRADQVEEPWLTTCGLLVYGPVIEEFRHRTLTPIGAPMCRRCKSLAGVEERLDVVGKAKGRGRRSWAE